MEHGNFSNDYFSGLVARVGLVSAPFFLFGLVNGIYNSKLAEYPVLFWVVDVLGWVVLPSLILLYLYKYYGICLHDYGLVKITGTYQRREILNWTVLATLLLGMYYFAFSWLTWKIITIDTPVFSYSNMVPEGQTRYFAIFYLAATAAIFEEIFFRGLIWRLIYASSIGGNKPYLYIFISSLLFGLVHWEKGLPEVISTMIFGAVACVIFLRLRNLLPLIAAHFFIDLVIFW